MKIGEKVKWFDQLNRITVTGFILRFTDNSERRAIVTHRGKFKDYFDIEIGCFALTNIDTNLDSVSKSNT